MKPALHLARALVATTLLGAAPSAIAAPAPPLAQALEGEAHDAYESGRALFKSGNYAAALARFEHAYAATPDPRLLWNMAACERKLGHDARVLSLVARYLVDGGAQITDGDRREAERFVTAVRARVAAVSVTTDPPGAHVRVDGASVGDTPLAVPIFLDPGTHRFEVTKDGYEMMAREETVAAGERRSVALGLQPAREVPAPREAEPPPAVVPAEPSPASGGLALSPAPPQEHERPARGGASSHVPALLVGGAGVASLGVGAALVIEASASYDRIQRQCAPSCDRSTWRGAQTREILGDVLLGVGAAAVAGGVVLWVTSSGGSREPAVGLFVAPAGALVHGTW